MPDVECDILGKKKNVLVKWGRNAGKWVSVAATITGTLSMIALLFSGIAKGTIDARPFAIFSIFPLAASISGLLFDANNRRLLVRQVVVNMVSMILYLFLIDANLLFQLI